MIAATTKPTTFLNVTSLVLAAMRDVFFFFERRWRNENLFPVILRLFHEIWKVYVECSKKVKWSSTLQLSVSFPRLFPIFLISLSTIDVQLCHMFCYLKKRLPSFSVVKEITACNSLISTYTGLRPPPPFLVYCIKSLKNTSKKYILEKRYRLLLKHELESCKLLKPFTYNTT